MSQTVAEQQFTAAKRFETFNSLQHSAFNTIEAELGRLVVWEGLIKCSHPHVLLNHTTTESIITK